MDDNTLNRIAAALETIAAQTSRARSSLDLSEMKTYDAFVFEAEPTPELIPVGAVSQIPFELLTAIDRVRDILHDNTLQFSKGLPANNTLLWGARGMGKSSLIKAVHHHINKALEPEKRLKLIEIHREDIFALPVLLRNLRQCDHKSILFCDDLSFDGDDTSYKSLKSVLDGGLQGRPDNVLFYATSNRRHLLPRDMIENERSTAINPSEAVQEKVSLSDRFGLWLGFHQCSQDDYLAMLNAYFQAANINVDDDIWRPEALEWSITRGSRSGRVAWQFLQHFAGKNGYEVKLKPVAEASKDQQL